MPDSSDELPEGVPSSAPLDIPEIETVDRHTQWVDFSLENYDYCQKPQLTWAAFINLPTMLKVAWRLFSLS